jgi:succinate dehydrogenase / fumarate reductase cytochrome b subunit
MATDNRPLSPHLQIYRPQITSVLSILHRITGVFMSLGALLLAYWLLALASGPVAYADALGILGSGPVMVLLFGLSFCFFYHLCNGIRHLAWDAGWGFELPQVYASGWAVVIASFLLTLGFWALLLVGGGAA